MKRHRTLVALAVAGLVVAGAVVVLYQSTASESDAISSAQTTAHSGAGASAGETPEQRAARLTSADSRIEHVATESDLLQYFDELEAEARARGHVDDELARADIAGKRLLATLPNAVVTRRMLDFGNRMRHVAMDLRVQPVFAALDALREQLAHERDPRKRSALLQQYAQTSAKLEVQGARLAAAEKLRAVLATSN